MKDEIMDFTCHICKVGYRATMEEALKPVPPFQCEHCATVSAAKEKRQAAVSARLDAIGITEDTHKPRENRKYKLRKPSELSPSVVVVTSVSGKFVIFKSYADALNAGVRSYTWSIVGFNKRYYHMGTPAATGDRLFCDVRRPEPFKYMPLIDKETVEILRSIIDNKHKPPVSKFGKVVEAAKVFFSRPPQPVSFSLLLLILFQVILLRLEFGRELGVRVSEIHEMLMIVIGLVLVVELVRSWQAGRYLNIGEK